MMATPARTKKLRPSDLNKSDEESPPAGDVKTKKKKEKPTNEINEIFPGQEGEKNKPKVEGKRLKPLGGSSGKGGAQEKKSSDAAGNKKRKRKGPVIEEEAQGRCRRISDGLAIYSSDELGFGNLEAKGTTLCPFDCSCCF